MSVERRPIFQGVKQLLRARRVDDRFTLAEVHLLDAAIDAALAGNVNASPAFPATRRTLGAQGIALIKRFEGCRLDAYPDPGTGGDPWTIGFGSTGPGIAKGVRWTQAQADERFAADLASKYGAAVDRLLGDTPTTQGQFDSMVSLAYNIGVGAFTRSSVLRLHKAGDHIGASRAFLLWNKAGGRVMKGLTRRRLAEADLYLSKGDSE